MLRRTCLFASLLLGGCVLGYRGEASVEAVYPLTGIDVVRVDLGPTPLTILGDDLAAGFELAGAWRSLGGSSKIAKEQALGSALVWAVDERFAELRAEVPIKLHGQVDFEVDEIRMPTDRDLELVSGLGDLYVFAVAGNISAELGVGHIDIDGGAGGLAVRTGEGNLHLRSSGNVDAHTGRGGARIYQTGAGGNDIVVSARGGDALVVLRSDANLDLQLTGREIRVHTGTVSTITRGSFTRQVGGGGVKIWVDAPTGNVEVRLDDSP
jgi:hypothetical protein